jgi:hypothetical protein
VKDLSKITSKFLVSTVALSNLTLISAYNKVSLDANVVIEVDYLPDGWEQVRENYFENPDTGEFFKMEKSNPLLRNNLDWNFEFNIRSFVQGPRFAVRGSNVTIVLDRARFGMQGQVLGHPLGVLILLLICEALLLFLQIIELDILH